jgi:glycosyltransferase involved in cell wall biosynthesis
MKRLAIFLFLALAAFAGSFAAARVYDLKSRAKVMPTTTSSFEPASFALVNRPFTVVIVGVNNGASVEKTISSVFSQNYENYRVIYIDDASDDGSYDLARDLIYASDKLAQVTLVHNDQRLGILANVSRAAKSCREEEIVVVLQGEDWLAHEWVLQRLNAYYADPDLWLAYGQAMDFPTYQLTPSQDFKDCKFRAQPSIGSHLKTFYAGLFQKIRESDFVYAGTYLPACSDLAYMIPMLEMGKDHFHFIPEVLCINNRQAIYKEDRETQIRCEKYIRSLDPYPTLTALQVTSCGE